MLPALLALPALVVAPALADDTTAPADDIPASDAPVVDPFGWVRPGGAWIQDDDAVQEDQDGFTVQARAGVEARMGDAPVSARVEVELLPSPTLKDAFVAWAPASWLELRAGQFRVPFSVQQLASTTRRQLPDDARAIGAVEIGREIGAQATLGVPIAGRQRLVLTSGVFNGEGANRIQNVNERVMFAQRATIAPFGARPSPFEGPGDNELYVGLGGGWVYDYAGDGETAEETNLLGADLQIAFSVLSLQAEWMDLEVVHANATVADYRARGGYVQAGCFVPIVWASDHVELVGRWETVEPNTAFGADAATSLEAFQAVDAIAVGANLYAWTGLRSHDLKLQAAWSHPTAREGEERADDRVAVSGMARF